MTLFAVICAAIYPGFHIGRVWMAWFMAPVPNSNGIWQNFRSPLLWDVFAVGTYFTVSVLFWYTGLIPDLATLRDRAKTKIRKFVYGILALGWRGSNRQWRHYEMAYLILAGLSTPLVLSVHSVVSFDFATSVIPGWHTTIFPPYFVAGAIFGGFAMVLTIMIPACAIYKPLHDLVTISHVDKMCKVIVFTGSIVGYAYLMELFMAWYSVNPYERAAFLYRATGPYWWAYCLHDVLQRDRAAAFLVQVFPHASGLGVDHRSISERWHVVRALRDHCHYARPRFHALGLGHVPSDMGRYLDVHRIAGSLLYALPALHPLSADDLHVRSQGGTPGSRPAPPCASRRETLEMPTNVAGNPESPFYGVAAEFDTAGELFHAAEKMRDEGFTRFDVFSPFPIHGMDACDGTRSVRCSARSFSWAV